MLFPGAVLPLQVFEPRYRRLVQEKLDFGVVLIRSGREVGEAPEELYEVGTIATLEQVEAVADGRFNVIARGLERFRLVSMLEPRDYLLAAVETLGEPEPVRSTRLLRLLGDYLRLFGLQLPPRLAQSRATRAVWLAGSLLQVEPAKRQRLLETGDPRLAEALLEEEVGRLRKLGGLGQMRPIQPSTN